MANVPIQRWTRISLWLLLHPYNGHRFTMCDPRSAKASADMVISLKGGRYSRGKSHLNPALGSHDTELVFNVTAVTAETNGENSVISSVGCKISKGVIPDLTLEIKEVGVNRQHIALIFRVLKAIEGSAKGYQFVAESVMHLGLYIPEDTRTFKSNKCMYARTDIAAHNTENCPSPLCILANKGIIRINEVKLLGRAQLLPSLLFSWQQKKHIAGLVSFDVVCQKMPLLYKLLAQNKHLAPKLSTLKRDERILDVHINMGYALYVALYKDRNMRYTGHY